MKYLMEHEMAFDAAQLGFPSISGCHAIVYQTSAGLYGYHNYGGSDEKRFDARAIQFASFVRDHGGLGHPATRLYGCSFIGNNGRGYSAPVKNFWRRELVEFASKLAYTGKISGYDLYKSFKGANASAYVEYRPNGTKCDVYIREWHDPGADAHPATAANPDQAAHKIMQAKGFNISIIDQLNVVSNVNRNNLTHISKEKLR